MDALDQADPSSEWTRRAVGYVRVSTEEQGANYGPDVQRAGIIEWAARNDEYLAGVFSDEISGTSDWGSRPGLAEALAQLEIVNADTLVVYRMDRLARDLILQETLLTKLASEGRRVVSVTEPMLEGDEPTRILIRQIMGAFSQYERSLITGRMMAGRRAKKAKGLYAGGQIPYGWKANGRGEFVKDLSEWAIVERIMVMHEMGFSNVAIARQLNAEGRSPRRGSRWFDATIGKIVARGMSTPALNRTVGA